MQQIKGKKLLRYLSNDNNDYLLRLLNKVDI